MKCRALTRQDLVMDPNSLLGINGTRLVKKIRNPKNFLSCPQEAVIAPFPMPVNPVM